MINTANDMPDLKLSAKSDGWTYKKVFNYSGRYTGFRSPDFKAFSKSGHPISGFQVPGYRLISVRIFMLQIPDFYNLNLNFIVRTSMHPDIETSGQVNDGF